MNWIVRIIALIAVVMGLYGQGEALAQQGCGGENMRPCTVTERIPSCNMNLVEGGNLCVRPDCGREGQRECSVVERMSTGVGTGTIAGPFPCDVNLKPSGTGFCVAVPCGKEGGPACAIWDRLPSCDANLVEVAGRCVHPPCGRDGERPCSALERRANTCDFNLTTRREPTGIFCRAPGIPYASPAPSSPVSSPPPAATVPPPATNIPRVAGVEYGFDRVGNDIGNFQLPTQDVSACQQACNRDSRCQAWTLVKPGVQMPSAVCYLKSPAPVSRSNNCCDSGLRTVAAAINIPPAPTPAPTPGFTPVSPMMGVPPVPVEAPLEKRTPTTTGTGNAAFAMNTDRMGGDIYGFPMSGADPALCQTVCNAHGECKAWTFVKPGLKGPAAQCFLKNTVPAPTANNCCTSGAKPTAAR